MSGGTHLDIIGGGSPGSSHDHGNCELCDCLDKQRRLDREAMEKAREALALAIERERFRLGRYVHSGFMNATQLSEKAGIEAAIALFVAALALLDEGLKEGHTA